MGLSVSQKDEIWFLRVFHHISNAVYTYDSATTIAAKAFITYISVTVPAPNVLAAEVFGTDI
jgi:hypothetical protein